MQFCYSTSFPPQPSGFYNHGQPCGFNTPTPPMPYPNGYPEIIGEGNVISVVTPDGSTQLIFLPTMQWSQRRTPSQNHYIDNLNNPHFNLGAWFVRNIGNAMQPSVFPQPQQECYGAQFTRSSASDFCLTLPQTGYPLKFHNDTCTSTTDIDYFLPAQYNWFQYPTDTAAVQVENPKVANAACNYDDLTANNEAVCTKPCNFICKCKNSHAPKEKVKCTCNKRSNNNISRMSIDSTRSMRKRRKEKQRKTKTMESKKSHKCECGERSSSDKSMRSYSDSSSVNMSVDSRKSKQKSSKRINKPSRICGCHGSARSKTSCGTSSNSSMLIDTKSMDNQRRATSHKWDKPKNCHKCECKETSAFDKAVTTYAEQGIGCAPDMGRETQTSPICTNTIPVIKVTKETCCKYGSPEPSTSKQAKKTQKGIKKSRSCDSSCSSRHKTISISGSCSGTTETELGYY